MRRRTHRFARRCRATTIFLAQTPQAFRRDVLAHALAAAGDTTVTDEAMLVERAGFRVHLVEGDPANIKVTTPEDLATPGARLRDRRPAAPAPCASAPATTCIVWCRAGR